MKKTILLIILLIPFISFAYEIGDVDGLNGVNSRDYLLIRKHLLNSPALEDDKKTRADVNGDGSITPADYNAIRRIIMGTYIPLSTPVATDTSTQSSKKDNPISVTASQSWTTAYSDSASNLDFKEATNVQGTVNYSIISQKNSGGTTVNCFSIPTGSKSTIRRTAKTAIGIYTVVIRAKASGNEKYNAGYKDITMKVTINKASTSTPKLNNLQIHFINADGFYDDAILIRSDKATIFIDGGRGQTAVLEYLKALKVKTIDYVIGSHTEYDHIDAQGAVIKTFNVKNVIYANDIYKCNCRCDNKDVKSVINALNNKKMTAKVQSIPSKLQVGDMILYFIAPLKLVCNKNNNSFIFILQYGNNKFMFTGDSDSVLYKPKELIENAKKIGLNNINVDMVKYPHHGNQNIPEEFLDASKPKMFVVPNVHSEGKPSTSIRNRLSKRGIKLYRQSDSKTFNLLLTSDGNNIKVTMDVKASTYAK